MGENRLLNSETNEMSQIQDNTGSIGNQGNRDTGDSPIVVDVFLSNDKMMAFLRAIDYKRGYEANNRMPEEYIQGILKEKGIVHGILADKISEYCLGNAMNKDFLIAKGTAPVQGENAKIKYFVDLEQKKGPRINSDGTVNYKELDNIKNVREGDLICKIIPPTEGTPGMNVFGETVPAQAGQDADVNFGEGIDFNEETREYRANRNGMFESKGGTISVKDCYVVNGDVGPATGNIRFNGPVKVTGNVLTGYSIYANGDVHVNGYVESSIITSTGDIIINNGVNGMNKGLIKSDGNVTTKFAEMARVIAGNDFRCDYCINSEVRAGNSLIAEGKQSSLMGGNYIAGRTITAGTVGSDLNIPVDIQIIPNWKAIINLKIKPDDRALEYINFINKSEDQISLLGKSVERLSNEMIKNGKKLEFLKGEQQELLKKSIFALNSKKIELEEELKEIKRKMTTMEKMTDSSGCRIVIKDIIHTGVRITIGITSLRINGRRTSTTFTEENSEIKSYNIT